MAIDWGVVLPNIIGSLILLALIVIFIYHSVNQKRPVYYFLTTLLLAFISTVLVVLAWIIFEDGTLEMQIMRSVYLSVSGLQICAFFMFLENSQRVKLSTWRLVVCISLLMFQIIGLLALVGFFESYQPYDLYYTTFWLIAKTAFNSLAIFVYGICGIPVYYQMYKYTKEKKSLITLISLIIMTFGYLFSLAIDIIDSMQELSDFWGVLKIFADNLPILGLFLVVLVYALDIKFIYRLPFNHYFLMVFYKTGLPIISVPFKTKEKKISLNESIFSGLMSALNTVYSSLLISAEPIDEIRSKGVTLLAENGKYISAIVASDQVSHVLHRGMKQFVNEFEEKFQTELEGMELNRDIFSKGRAVFQRIFPFLIPEIEQKLK
ncbi:MAG: hypothetical protein ACTSWC_13210 [Promethearchaeota archaeon]